MAQYPRRKEDHRPARIRLASWRERSGLTQEQAAVRLSVALRTYQRWESGDQVPQVSTSINVESETGIQWNAWLSARGGWQCYVSGAR